MWLDASSDAIIIGGANRSGFPKSWLNLTNPIRSITCLCAVLPQAGSLLRSECSMQAQTSPFHQLSCCNATFVHCKLLWYRCGRPLHAHEDVATSQV